MRGCEAVFSADCSERTCWDAGQATKAAIGLDHRQVVAFELDNGARLAHYAGLAFGACVAHVRVDIQDGTHQSLIGAIEKIYAREYSAQLRFEQTDIP